MFRYKAIVYCEPSKDQREFKKYTNVTGSEPGIAAFYEFIKQQFPAAKHINFYEKKTGIFVKQVKITRS